MRENDLVSVIIPVFNSEKYLSIMMESVLEQTYHNIEIILVNDGSDDNSGKMCDRYAEQDTRVKVWHIENGGAAVARNVGIQNSRGKYICFIDSDDMIANDYIDYLIDCIKKYDLDIMVCGYKKVYYLDQCISNDKEYPVKKMSGADALEDMLYRKNLTSGPCYKIVLRDIVLNNMFPEGRLFEDLGCVYKWYAEATSVGYSEKVGYYYFMHENSCQHSQFREKKWDLIEISEEIYNFVKQNFPEKIPASVNRLFVSAVQLLREIPKEQYPDKYGQLVRIIKETRTQVVRDADVKASTRVLAIISMFSIGLIRFMGKQYDFWISKLKIRMKY